METVRTDRHDESLFDTEPSPQPDEGASAHAAGTAPPASEVEASGPAVGPAVDAAGGASIADGIERHPDANHVIVQRIVGGIVAAVMGFSSLVGLTIVFFTGVPPWVLLLIGSAVVVVIGLMAWSAWAWPPLEHRYASYRVGPLGIELRKGVVFRRAITVPRSRIQHTDVAQGPIERPFGLATLHLFTAGTEHSKVELHGLRHEVALKIRDHLVTGGEDDAV